MFKLCLLGLENCLFDVSSIKGYDWYFQSDEISSLGILDISMSSILEKLVVNTNVESFVKTLTDKGSRCLCVSTQITNTRESEYKKALDARFSKGIDFMIVNNNRMKVSLYNTIIKYSGLQPYQVLVIDSDKSIVSFFSDNGVFGYLPEDIKEGMSLGF